MSQCHRCQDLLDDYLSDQLSDGDKVFCQEHLEHCSVCQEVLLDYKQLDNLLEQWSQWEVEPPVHFHQQVMSKLENIAPVKIAKSESWINKYGRKLMPIVAAAALVLVMTPTVMSLMEKNSLPLDDQNETQKIAQKNDEGINLAQGSIAVPDLVEQQVPSTETKQENGSAKPRSIVDSHPQPEVAKKEVSENNTTTTAEVSQPPQAMVADQSDQVKAASDASAQSEPAGGTMPRSISGHSMPVDEQAIADQSLPDWATELENAKQKLAELQAEKETLQLQRKEPNEAIDQALLQLDSDIERLQKLLKAIEDQDLEAYQALVE